MKILYKKRGVDVSIKETGFFGKSFGLMFKGRDTENLLFVFGKSSRAVLTSLFVFFPFIAVWLNSKNIVVDWRFVRPFSMVISTTKKFEKIIEIPINYQNRKVIEFFVDDGKI